MAKAIEFFRSVPRWLLVRALSSRWPAIASGPLSCIHMIDADPPELPAQSWVRVKTRLSGICGSDLSAIGCKGSPYFSPFVSTPFIPGHELVGDIVETGSDVPATWKIGTRVVIEPALSCEVRGITPPCRPCANGLFAHCENILKGSIAGGIQTGYCSSTGGGWSAATLVAHHSQLHVVPPGLSDAQAVLAEPFACSIHAALKAPLEKDATILVLGCGSIGLMAISAYRLAGGQGRVLAAARYDHQASMATKLGADDLFRGRSSEALYKWTLDRAEPSASGSNGSSGGIYRPEIGKPVLLGGVDCVIDCVGSSQSIDDSMRLTRPRGTVVLAGMPGSPSNVDWTSIWYKELRLQGSYAYGWESLSYGETRRVRTMDLALSFLQQQPALQELVNKRFPLDSYQSALETAFNAGRTGALKTVFEVN
jgi:threonine dehydrogenase-like Zn-dependent dehydrogenase